MATILDAGSLLSFLLPVFSFLLVFSILFALLQKTKFLTDNSGVNVTIAVAVSVLFAVMPGAMKFVSIITPWFVVMLMVAFSFILIFLFMGVKTETLEKVAHDATVRWTVIIIGIIIVVVGLTAVFGPIFGTPTPEAGGGMGTEIQRSLFDPKVLTTVFILLVAGQAARLLAQKE